MWVGSQGERRKCKGGGWDDAEENRKPMAKTEMSPLLSSRSSNHRTESDGWEGKWGSGRTKAAITRSTAGRRTGGRGRAGRWADRKLCGHERRQASGSDGIWPIDGVGINGGGNKWGGQQARKQPCKGQQKLTQMQMQASRQRTKKLTGGAAWRADKRVGGQGRRVHERTSEADGLESWRAGVSGRSTTV